MMPMSNRPLARGDLEPYADRHDAPPDPGPPPDPIRIVLLAPPVVSVDAAAPGGLLHLARLAAGLAGRGHQVTLIGAGTASVAGLGRGGFELIDTDPTQCSADGPDPEPGERRIVDRVHYRNLTMILDHLRPDVVGDHTHTGYLPRGTRAVPTAVTIYHHRRPFELFGGQPERLPAHVHLVAISAYQRRLSRDWPWRAVIPPGIPLHEYPLSLEHGGPALFLGPRAPVDVDGTAVWLDAGIALRAAHQARVPIVLAGTDHGPDAAVDLDELLAREPLGPDDRLLVRVDACQRRELLAGARCLVAPLLLDPPCSLEVLEALAVGTPVVGVQDTLGAELVRPHASGLLVGLADVDRLVELPAAIRQAGQLNPKTVRQQAARFDLPVMVRAYEALFARLTEARP
jgi:glycosyltransferase involved in cell wall biosynthesis